MSLAIVQETKNLRLEINFISNSGIRQPCDVEIRPYCMVLTQTDREGKMNKVLLSELQYDELKEEMNKTGD